MLSFLLALIFGQRIGFVDIRILALFATGSGSYCDGDCRTHCRCPLGSFWSSANRSDRVVSPLGRVLRFSKLHIQTSTFEYLLRFLPIGLGMGIFSSPNKSTIMGTAPCERLGIVSSILAVNRTLAQMTGIAIMGPI